MSSSAASAPGGAGAAAGHAFISYVREDSLHVDRLQQILEDAGIPVWRDTARLWPGQDWRAQVRGAITSDALVFLACFSRASLARAQSYQNEELNVAIEQLRLRPHGGTWLIPIRFDDCQIPDWDIGGGRTLRYLHCADFFGDDYYQNAQRLVQVIRQILAGAAEAGGRSASAARNDRAPGAPAALDQLSPSIPVFSGRDHGLTNLTRLPDPGGVGDAVVGSAVAGRAEVVVYLRALAGWLNTDPWPQDKAFGGPALVPAAIERKLMITDGPGQGARDLDADDLAGRCARLVVLGGPGSGKTWLARRAARRCAERALQALQDGSALDEVELPLYTTCARLAAAPPGDGIRRAVVAGTLGQLPDLGGARVLEALRVLFEERNAPVLLVADSLDEARGADDRIRQADTLPPPWRIMLTSRPSSWSHQLAIIGNGPERRAGALQPLRYPDDAEPFIDAWLSAQPERAANLKAQLHRRPDLQQAAIVPLILAFYCILGGDEPLPKFRHELSAKVISRLLTGRWRSSRGHDPDTGARLETLRRWAWSAAVPDRLSGTGAWADEFLARRAGLSRDDQEALDHVAVPLGPPDPDTAMTQRRFVHRSLHEHLVAEHVAAMPAEKAAAELLNHLWYDPDWEYTAPAALARHPQRDQVLKTLVRRVTGHDQIPADLSAIDGCWEIRRFLAKAARESSENDWLPETQAMIGKARQDLATLRRNNLSQWRSNLSQVPASDWPTSNRPIIESLLGLLPGWYGPWYSRELAEVISGLDPTADQRARTLEALHGLLARETDPQTLDRLVEAVTRFSVTAHEGARARKAVLGLLTGQTNPHGWLMEKLAELDPPAEEQAQAREVLLRMLARERDSFWIRRLVKVFPRLGAPAEEQARAWKALLDLLTRETDYRRAQNLVTVLCTLGPPAEEQARARETLLGLLTTRESIPRRVEELVKVFAGLRPSAEERARARAALLGLLTRQTDPWKARKLAIAVTGLAVTAQEQARTRKVLLGLLAWIADPAVTWDLMEALAGLDPPADEQAQARGALLGLLTRETSTWQPTGETSTHRARRLAEVLYGLDPPAEERARAQEALLGLLTRQTDPWESMRLAEVVARLAATEQERTRAREVLLGLLSRGSRWVERLVEVFAGLDPTAEERARVREALLGLLLSRETNPWESQELVEIFSRLEPSAEERARVLEVLPGLFTRETNSRESEKLAKVVAGLAATAQERERVRKALLGLLTRETKPAVAQKLAAAAARLSPTVGDLGEPDTWPCAPTHDLLAAVRQNSRLAVWIAILPQLPEPTRIPG
jgi:hypothetical protein